MAKTPERLLSHEVYLNLTPLLDVLSNLMFFLLATFGTTAVVAFSVSLPVQEAAVKTPPRRGTDIAVMLELRADGAQLSCSAADRTPGSLVGCRQRLRYAADAPDVAALGAALRRIKESYADATTLVVVAAAGLRVGQLVPQLDAARTFVGADGQRRPLFDTMVLAPPPLAPADDGVAP